MPLSCPERPVRNIQHQLRAVRSGEPVAPPPWPTCSRHLRGLLRGASRCHFPASVVIFCIFSTQVLLEDPSARSLPPLGLAAAAVSAPRCHAAIAPPRCLSAASPPPRRLACRHLPPPRRRFGALWQQLPPRKLAEASPPRRHLARFVGRMCKSPALPDSPHSPKVVRARSQRLYSSSYILASAASFRGPRVRPSPAGADSSDRDLLSSLAR